MKRAIASSLVAVASLFAVGCAHTPTKAGERADLVSDAQQTLDRMEGRDPELRSLIDSSAGVIVFPRVGEGGFVVGGGGGAGVVFEHGEHKGFAELTHISVGALAGGQKYSQIVVVRDAAILDDMKNGRFDFGAKASAVIVREGAAGQASFQNGVAVFMDPIGGAMVNASLSGQRIRLKM